MQQASSFKIILLLLFSMAASAFSQQGNLDWKVHDVGQVRQFISNIGSLWPTSYLDFTGLIYCEYPPNSFEEHVGEGGIWVGAVVGSDTMVSVTTSWNSPVEFFPTAEPYDTIWAVGRGDTVDIPYWPGYVGLSDEDFVCRYSDYNLTNIGNHKPLYLDVIQVSRAWSSPPLDEMIAYHYRLISTRNDLKNVYIAFWLDGNVGYRGQGWGFALDDLSLFYENLKLGVAKDDEGQIDGDAYGPIGITMRPPEGTDPASLRWTFNWYEGQGGSAPPASDSLRYIQMSEGIIMQNQQEPVGSQFIISFGPFNINHGDTLDFAVGEILGEGLNGVLDNTELFNWLVDNDFRTPSPPPKPPLRVEIQDQQVVLAWDPQPGQVDPETYFDPYRADSMAVPFEGYRVYKSTQGPTGPWTLLGEYDSMDDFGNNTGLERSYSDYGLLNNLEYYYSVTSFSKPDTTTGFPSLESSINENAVEVIPGTAPPNTVGNVMVVPNPYRGDIAYNDYNPPWEKPDPSRARWMEQDRRIQFVNLPAQCEIRIYTLAGDLVSTISHQDPNKGYEDWNLTSDIGQAVSSGIYLFSVEDLKNGKIQIGKFVIIK
ncbi:MAG: hypothetical protein WAN36_14485 [Calditrichia bacterium]